jgi:hypothetical protein
MLTLVRLTDAARYRGDGARAAYAANALAAPGARANKRVETVVFFYPSPPSRSSNLLYSSFLSATGVIFCVRAGGDGL